MAKEFPVTFAIEETALRQRLFSRLTKLEREELSNIIIHPHPDDDKRLTELVNKLLDS